MTGKLHNNPIAQNELQNSNRESGISYDYLLDQNEDLSHENEILVEELEQLKSKDNSFWMAALEKSDGTELFNSMREFVQDWLNHEKSNAKNKMLHSFSQTVITTFFLGLILIAALYLTTQGFLDGSSTTFLIGTITGYYITYLTRREVV